MLMIKKHAITPASATLNKLLFRFFLFFYFLALLLMFHTSSDAKESGNAFSPHDVTQGTLLFMDSEQKSFAPAPTLHTKAHISITGLIARTTVRQEFQNPGMNWGEGIYVFPLPETAAVDHLRMKIGKRMIEGVIKERGQAKKIYAAAKKEGRKASMIEQERPNIFTTSVANIGPKETIIIEIEYQETVHYEQGQFSLRFPMVIGPRYIPGTPKLGHQEDSNVKGHGWARNTNEVPDASRITPPVNHPDGNALNLIQLTLDLAPGFPLANVASSYHAIRHSHNEYGHYHITLKENEILAERDFELKWSPQGTPFPLPSLFIEHFNQKTYGLLMVTPPAQSFANQITLPRDVTFVIDTSGSMYGTSIEQAKLALELALTRLKPLDQFNIIQFNNETQALFPSSQPVTSRTIQLAIEYVKRLVAEGGTEMLPALQQALQPYDNNNRLRQVIFMTDGQIGNEKQLFLSINQHLSSTRLFTVGIGSAPNSYFMRKAAKFGKGTFTYIGHATEVQNKMDQLFRKLEHPILTDIEIELPASNEMEVEPEHIPDLYLGEPLMITFRTLSLPEQIRIRGRVGVTPWSTSLPLQHAPERPGVAVNWARQKIDSLMDSHSRRKKAEAVRQHVINVALRHHLVSRYTSLIAVDVTPARPLGQTLSTHPIKTNLPYGQDYTAIFGLSAGATPGPRYLLVGLFLLLIAGGGYQWGRTRT